MNKNNKMNHSPVPFQEQIEARIDVTMSRYRVDCDHLSRSTESNGGAVASNKRVMSRAMAAWKTFASNTPISAAGMTFTSIALGGASIGGATAVSELMMGGAANAALLGVASVPLLAPIVLGTILDSERSKKWLRIPVPGVYRDYLYGRSGLAHAGVMTSGNRFVPVTEHRWNVIETSSLVGLSAEQNADLIRWDGMFASLAKDGESVPDAPAAFSVDFDAVKNWKDATGLRRSRLLVDTLRQANTAVAGAWAERAAVASNLGQGSVDEIHARQALSDAAQSNAAFFSRTAEKMSEIAGALTRDIERFQSSQAAIAAREVGRGVAMTINTETLLGGNGRGGNASLPVEREARSLSYQYAALTELRSAK